MKRLYKDGGEMILEKKKKHPTREILEKGGIVDGEDFELMLREEAEVNRMEILESIEENLIQLNKTMYEILHHIKERDVSGELVSFSEESDSKMLEVYRILQTKMQPFNEGKAMVNAFSALEFNEQTQEILIEEELLMRAIIIANNFQTPRKLKLITRAERKAFQKHKHEL